MTAASSNGTIRYSFQGSKCSGPERQKAAALVQAIDDERGGKPTKVIVREDESDKTDADYVEFWKLLGGGPAPIAAADDLDDKWEEGHAPELWRLSDAKGTLQLTPEGKGIIPKSKLDTKDVFILDVGNEIFVWIGLKTSDKVRLWCSCSARVPDPVGNRSASLRCSTPWTT